MEEVERAVPLHDVINLLVFPERDGFRWCNTWLKSSLWLFFRSKLVLVK